MKATAIYNKQNQAIHGAMATLGMPYRAYQDTWLQLMADIAGCEISGMSALTLSQRRSLITHLRTRGAKVFNAFVPKALCDWKKGNADVDISGQGSGARGQGFPGRPSEASMNDLDKGRMLKKIEAMLAEAGRPWDYAHGMARQMHGVDRVEWCNAAQVHKIVAAMVYDAKKHGRYLG